MDSLYLQHYGVLGMHWGVRRYQNADGTLTNAGKRHYNSVQKKVRNANASYESNKTKRLKRTVEANNAEVEALRNAGYFEEADAVSLLSQKDQEKLGRSVLKDANKQARKQAKLTSRNRFAISDQELLEKIGRLEKQKRLRELTNDETKLGESEYQRRLISAGQDMTIGALKGAGGVAVTAATGSAKLGLSTALENAPKVDVANRTISTTRVNTNKPITSSNVYSPIIGTWKITNDGQLYIPDSDKVREKVMK